MLVLSRKKDESIVINDNVRIMVVEVRGDKVRLGIDAPRHVTVHREEIYEAIKREQLQDGQLVNSGTSERAEVEDTRTESQARG